MELAVQVERLTLVEIDADGIELALKVDTMMVLNVIRVGTIATGCDRLDEVVVFVLLLYLIIAQQHIGINASRISGRLVALVVKQLYAVILALFALEVGQETEFVVDFVLVEIIQLTRYLGAIARNNSTAHFAIIGKRNDYGLVCAIGSQRIGYTYAYILADRKSVV